MMKEPRDNGTILPGLKPVLELLEREPEKVDVVYVRKGRASADSDRILDLCRDYGVRFQLVDADGIVFVDDGQHTPIQQSLQDTHFPHLFL